MKMVILSVAILTTACSMHLRKEAKPEPALPQYPAPDFYTLENFALKEWHTSGKSMEELARIYIDSDNTLQQQRQIHIRSYGTDKNLVLTTQKELIAKASSTPAPNGQVFQITTNLELDLNKFNRKEMFIEFIRLNYTEKSPKRVKKKFYPIYNELGIDDSVSYIDATFSLDFDKYVFDISPKEIEENLQHYGSSTNLKLPVTANFYINKCEIRKRRERKIFEGNWKIQCDGKLLDIYYYFKEQLSPFGKIMRSSVPHGKLRLNRQSIR